MTTQIGSNTINRCLFIAFQFSRQKVTQAIQILGQSLSFPALFSIFADDIS